MFLSAVKIKIKIELTKIKLTKFMLTHEFPTLHKFIHDLPQIHITCIRKIALLTLLASNIQEEDI